MDMSETTDSSGPLSPLLDDAESDADSHSDSSADVTSELPAADRTVTDLEPLTPESAAAAAEAAAPPAETHAPDATGEIEALDILEVVAAQDAQPLRAAQPPSDAVHASTIPVAPPSSRAAEVLETSRLPAVIIAGQQQSSAPSIPAAPVAAAPQGYHPSSIAPLALDVTPAPRPSYASSASWHPRMAADPRESTVEIARAAGIPSRASRVVVFTASVAGMCLVAGILGVMIGYSHGPASNAQPQSLAAPGPNTTSNGTTTKGSTSTAATSTGAVNPAIPHTPVVTGAREEITEGPILVPAKDAASIAEGPDDGLTISAADDAPTAASAPIPTPLAVATPAPVTAPAPAPRAAAPAAPITRSAAPARTASSGGSASGGSASSSNASSSTGVLRLPSSVSGVLIDGVPHRAGGGGLVVTCGRHTVKAPGHPSRLVIIPCGGSAAL